MADPNTYTVGWICAVTTELVAAKALLDREHPKPETLPPNDNNTYTFGEIGGHNIVIAALPFWQYGIASAARVAGDLVRSFPSIRIGLMVGIGGGAPTVEDIRLGDIVVGVPGYGNSGVYQYDYGMAIQGQEFVVTGTLNQAPMCCLTAVSDLAAEHMLKGNNIADDIRNIIKKYPHLSQSFDQPDLSTDRLYQSDYVHSQGRKSCEVSCDCSRLVSRPDRYPTGRPKVHFGLIASANTLMKDAVIRDKLSSTQDILCFEMEAAGLSNHFPCLVIRGICDYADSHKNNQWQGYAALGAAAYAKQLLLRIIPSSLMRDNMMENFILTVKREMSQVLSSVNETNQGVKALNLRSQKESHYEVLEWLSKADFTLRHRDIAEQRLSGTGQWFLESNEFQTWLSKDQATLFCTGSPGAGKTFISSLVIDHLQTLAAQNPKIRLAYIYCDYKRDGQQPTNLLSSIIRQLSDCQRSLPNAVTDLYARCRKDRKPPSFTELSETFRSIVDSCCSKVFVVIDALDEFGGTGANKKMVLESILQSQITSKSVLITSRPIGEPGIQLLCGEDITLEILAKDRDIKSYINWRILHHEQLSIDDRLRERIVGKIQQSADERFLLVVGQMDQLLSQPTIRDLKLTMRNLHKGNQGLKDQYMHQLQGIQRLNEASRNLVYRILSWIVFAKRPLSCLELRHAVAIQKKTRILDNDCIPSQAAIQSLCAGFVVFDSGSQKPRLIHLTLHEFLLENLDTFFPKPGQYLLSTCLTYLGFDCFSTGPCGSGKGYMERKQAYIKRKQDNPFYEYAAWNWGYHTSGIKAEDLMKFKFLRHDGRLSSSIEALRLKAPDAPDRFSQDTSTIHLAAYFGITQLVERLLRRRERLNQKNSLGRTPLWYAAEQGHNSVVSLLIGFKGIDVDTPLAIAVRRGHEAVVKLLLDLNHPSYDYDVLFISAAEYGHAGIVKLLLDTGKVDVNAEDFGTTALLHASYYGHTKVVEQILDTNRADVDALDLRGNSAYTWAVRHNNVDIVKLLLGQPGIDFDRWMYGHSPLSQAATNNNEDLFFVLLDSGLVDPRSKQKGVETCLTAAAWNGNMRIVKALVERVEVDLNEATEDMERTALLEAIDNGHLDVVKYLLETGKVDIEARDAEGCNGMEIARSWGHDEIIQLLSKYT